MKNTIFKKMLFGMPVGIHAKIGLSVKSWGDLKTAWIGFAHRLINIPHKAFILCEKSC